MIATSWFTLDPVKVRNSQADLCVFVILTLKHAEHFVVIPTRELLKRVPRGSGSTWNLYLWVFDDGSCYQVRGLGREETVDILHRGVRDPHRDFSEWLEYWSQLDKLTRLAREPAFELHGGSREARRSVGSPSRLSNDSFGVCACTKWHALLQALTTGSQSRLPKGRSRHWRDGKSVKGVGACVVSRARRPCDAHGVTRLEAYPVT